MLVQLLWQSVRYFNNSSQAMTESFCYTVGTAAATVNPVYSTSTSVPTTKGNSNPGDGSSGNSKHNSNSISTGAIVGIAVGAGLGIIGLALIACVCMKNRALKRALNDKQSPPPVTPKYEAQKIDPKVETSSGWNEGASSDGPGAIPSALQYMGQHAPPPQSTWTPAPAYHPQENAVTYPPIAQAETPAVAELNGYNSTLHKVELEGSGTGNSHEMA
jgi:hypothetical protein